MISILYPTKRIGNIDILFESLIRQTFQDYEVIIIDELFEYRSRAVSDFAKDKGLDGKIIHIPAPPKPEEHYRNTSASMNAGIKIARGELIANLIDFVWIPSHGLESFVKNMEKIENRGIVASICHRLKPLQNYTHDKNEFTTFKESFLLGGLSNPEITWYDVRKRGAGLRLGKPADWENCFAIAPGHLFREIGGWDTGYDKFVGAFDNQYFSEAAEIRGYPTYIDQDVECMHIPHEIYLPEPPQSKEDNMACMNYHIQVVDKIKKFSTERTR